MARLINSGYLFKAPPRNEKLLTKFAVQWRWRWFKLWSNKEFHYYEDFSCSKKKGSILLDKVDISDIKYPIALPKHPWVISINVVEDNREYLLAAADGQSLLKWGEALELVLKVDYIPVSEIASTNKSPKRRASEDGTSYLKIYPDRERLQTYQSSESSSISPAASLDIPMDRVSKVGPYEVYDPENIYVPMNPHGLNEDDAMPDNLKKVSTDYESCDIEDDINDDVETFEPNPKISASTDVYESMSPTQKAENGSEGCSDTQELDEVIPETNDRRYDHLGPLTDMLLAKAEESRDNRVQTKSQSTSDYDDIVNVKITNKEDSIDFSRQGRAHTINQVEVEDEIGEQPIRPRKGSGLGILEDLRKGEVGKFQILLESYWVMHIYLPNRTVVKELVNLEAPVEVLIERLALLFGQQNNLHIFSLYVLSDIHQTYDIIKKADKELGKGDLRLNHNMSFVEQGITTAKFLQIVSTKEIDRVAFDGYLRRKDGMKLTQEFCETWIPFVKGYFSIPDLREVATLAGYIHFVYQNIYDLKSISHEIFLPRNSKEIDECIKKTREQSLQLKGTSLKDACKTFINRIVIWPTANTIAFPIKRTERTNFRVKNTEILVVFAKEHIGIVKAEKNIDYGNFMYWWHKNDISDFEVNNQKDLLVLKLAKPFDEGSCEFYIKSPMNKILNQLLENFKNAKKKVVKHNSVGNIPIISRKPHSDIFETPPNEDDN